MAILSGINTNLRGSAGSWTFCKHKGQTVAKQKVDKKSTPVRTLRLMRRRTQLGNLVNMYRAFAGNLHPSFQGKGVLLTDYNEFVSANFNIVKVYLTKSERRSGGCVAAPYMITNGSLPSIEVSGGSVQKTDIALGSTFAITASTTVKEFSDAVIASNPDRFCQGDQITCYIAIQKTNNVTHVPYIVVKCQKVTLNRQASTILLRSVVGAEGFSVVDGHLGAGAAINGAIAWVHSRRSANGTQVSSQYFVVTNSLLASYQSEAHLTAAIDSYGGVNKEEYLTPDNDDQLDIDLLFGGGGSNPSPSSEQEPRTARLELRAPNPGSLTFTVNGEEYEEPMQFEIGTTVAVHAEPSNGWNFVKWRDIDSSEPDYEFEITGDTVLIGDTEEA